MNNKLIVPMHLVKKPKEKTLDDLSDKMISQTLAVIKEAKEEEKLHLTCTLFAFCFEVAKQLEGKEFVSLWINAALEDLDNPDQEDLTFDI